MAKFARLFSLFAVTGAAVLAIAGIGCRAAKQSGDPPPLPPPVHVPAETNHRVLGKHFPAEGSDSFIAADPVSPQAGYAGLKQALEKVQTEHSPSTAATQLGSRQIAGKAMLGSQPAQGNQALGDRALTRAMAASKPVPAGKTSPEVAQALAQLDTLPNLDRATKQELRAQMQSADPQEAAILLGYLQLVIQRNKGQKEESPASSTAAMKVEPGELAISERPTVPPRGLAAPRELTPPREMPLIAGDPPRRSTPEPARENPAGSPAAGSNAASPTASIPGVAPVAYAQVQVVAPPKLAEAAMGASPQVSPTQTPGQLAGDPKKWEESDNWRQKLDAAIASMQAAANQPNAPPAEKASLEAALRLLQVAAQKKQDAVRGVSGWDGGPQQFWSHQMHALATWLDAESLPREDRRAAVALRQLREGAGELAALSTLDVSNLAFCSEVQSFGRYTEFKTREFKPDQEVLLYCEIDNFTSDKTAQGYETSLQGSYQIVDRTGRRLAEHTFQTESEVCRNRRRDYFVPFRLWIPKTLSPGSYVLQLSVEDLKGKKFGQGSIDFVVK